MKVRAKETFGHVLDLTVNRARLEGEVFEVGEERADLLLSMDLVDVIVEDKEKLEKMKVVAEIIEKPKRKKK